VDLGKLRRGELVAAVGGILLLITLFFVDWYSAGASVTLPLGTTVNVHGDFGAWDGEGFFGFLANLVILSAGVAAITLAVLKATSRTVALPMAASAITAALGIAAVLMVLLRMVFQPGPNDLVDLKFGIVLALIASLIVAYGGWDAMKEEGTTFDSARDQLQARYARRPAPDPRPSAPTSEPAPAPARPADEPQPPSTPPPTS
jgi:hypothetical protein